MACVFPNENYRTGKLHRQGVVFQAYGDQPSKVTGEFVCFHLEAKITSSRALRRIGITHPKDLLSFDVNAFWDNNLIFLDVDRERLGRWYINKNEKKRLRSSPITTWGYYNVHKVTGGRLFRIHGRDEFGHLSVQRFIDQMGSGPYVIELPIKEALKTAGVSQESADLSMGSEKTLVGPDYIRRVPADG